MLRLKGVMENQNAKQNGKLRSPKGVIGMYIYIYTYLYIDIYI